MDNLTMIKIEPWFLPIDIILIITTGLTIILGLIFLLITISHKICWSVPMLLTCHSCSAVVFLNCCSLSMAIFTFVHDLKQDTGNVLFCVIIGFLGYVTVTLQNYSYLLAAIYRYISVVYPARILWQSAKFQISLIVGQWIFSIVFALPLLLTGQIIYNMDNQICQVPLHLSITIIYTAIILYIIPNLGILVTYIKLTRYVQQMSNRTILFNTLFHARRELRLVQRTFILTSILIILGMPYMLFILISFITIPPKYHFRIAFTFVDISMLLIMIITYYFTQQIKEITQKILPKLNAIEPMRDSENIILSFVFTLTIK